MSKYYKVELDGKVVVRSSENRKYPCAVIFKNHWITTGYASFCGSFEAAEKVHASYTKKYFNTSFTIVPTTEISESEFKTIKAKLNAIKKQLMEEAK